IEGCAIIIDSIIKKGARLKLGVRIEKSEVGESASVGPFCHLRPGASLSKDVRVGNFVEVKNSSLGTGTKAGHLTYIGDAEVGEGVNFGAGTITANYDGFRKHKTTIKNGASTGSNSVLVAPVTIGKNAYIGACSAITKDVSDGALAIARPKQVEIKGWFQRRIEQETKDQNKKDA
ncbi:MAG: bifunctional N-acetylglucosamine-1-phosphate uridyltransferase/glucosamine-1-phosphate acetyltransferase, partial [Candidatus Dadabacteria bacterium]